MKIERVDLKADGEIASFSVYETIGVGMYNPAAIKMMFEPKPEGALPVYKEPLKPDTVKYRVEGDNLILEEQE
jgi:hypothetical protein